MLPHSFFVLVLSWQQINSIPLIPTNFYRIYSISSFFFYPHHCHTINALGNPKLSAYFTFIFIVSLFCSLFITLVNRFHSFFPVSVLSRTPQERTRTRTPKNFWGGFIFSYAWHYYLFHYFFSPESSSFFSGSTPKVHAIVVRKCCTEAFLVRVLCLFSGRL